MHVHETETLSETVAAPKVAIRSHAEAAAREAAERIATLAGAAISTRGRFSIALSGGDTPGPLYSLLATPAFASRMDWSRIDVFWGDERCVAPDHPESNFRMACARMLDHVPIAPGHVHRIQGEREPHEAAHAYERLLRSYFGAAEGPPERSFDLVLLGMGVDGHTASLFPDTPPVTETRRWVLESHASQPPVIWRVTLTPVVLDAADVVMILVTGASKAERLREALEDPTRSPPLPIQRIRPTHGALAWIVDAAAASWLRRARC